ncbi:MAG: hypothetical protein ACP5U1_02765 [Desulfomonilaceae bacterium]
MVQDNSSISKYLDGIIEIKRMRLDDDKVRLTRSRIIKAFEIVPEDVLSLFLGGYRRLRIAIIPDATLSLGTRTTTQRVSGHLIYSLSICSEALDWPEDHFLGAILRELGHVTAELLPENEWPPERGARARYKESIECRADALVWSWGLRHYDMIFLSQTYPSHWVDKIVNDISMMLLSMGTAQSGRTLS